MLRPLKLSLVSPSGNRHFAEKHYLLVIDCKIACAKERCYFYKHYKSYFRNCMDECYPPCMQGKPICRLSRNYPCQPAKKNFSRS